MIKEVKILNKILRDSASNVHNLGTVSLIAARMA